MEDFQALFLASLGDGSYNDWLREKVEMLRDKRHLWSLRCIQDTGRWINANLQETPGNAMFTSSNGWTPDLRWAEMANTIAYDSMLSQSYGNPEWYPPVPKYTVPKWRNYTWDEIRVIQKMKQIANTPNFVKDFITITRTPISVEELEAQCEQLTQLDPSILGSTIIHERDIDVNTRFTRTPDSPWQITAQVGYLVNVLVDPKNHSTELIGIYVHQSPTILRELLEFLAKLDVSNHDDLMEARIALSELYWSITPKA